MAVIRSIHGIDACYFNYQYAAFNSVI